MRSQIAQRFRGRNRSASLTAVPPPRDSPYYLPELAKVAKRILYRSPLPSHDGLPVYILNAAAFPDTFDIDYDSLLPYVLERLPGEDELLSGRNYEVVFLAGGPSEGAVSSKKSRPSWPWFIQAYQVLSRALRKRIQKLYIVHERSWVRILVEMFSTIVSPKSRRKIFHVSTLSQLALQIPIEDLLIPPSAYLYDRQLSPDIHAPYASGRRAFGAKLPLPRNAEGGFRLPRVLRETTSFILMGQNVKVEGIFRIPPHAKLKEILKEAYDRGQKYIIWKENHDTLPVPAYPRATATGVIIGEIEPVDAYGVYLATSLIKAWYSELRRPLFPTSAYADIRKLFDNQAQPIATETLTELVSPHSEFPMLPIASRQILVDHLIPMLSEVSGYEASNKMNADNLAMCFSPALLCGEDPMEDAKMSSIVRRILASAIERWEHGLREACHVTSDHFAAMLQPPAKIEEYEDPLDNGRVVAGSPAYYDAQKQTTGIIMQDNDLKKENAPPLPPRPAVPYESDQLTGWTDSVPRRKPAPRVSVPPRYSAVIAQDAVHMAESPLSYDAASAAVTDGFAPVTDLASGSVNGPPVETNEKPSQIILPKRKALTSDLLSEKQPSEEKTQIRSMSESQAALSGILAGQAAEFIRRKPVNSGKDTDDSAESSPTTVQPSSGIQRRAVSQAPGTQDASGTGKQGSDDSKFTKPTWAASAKPLLINTLAKPVYPSSGPNSASTTQDSPNSLPPPSYAPKARTPSPRLLQRMPSFEPSKPLQRQDSSDLRVPGKLNLKKPSVDDLRRLYEERAGTAKSLVEVSSPKNGTEPGFSPSE
ncbi:hypothetical protein NA57DRAFT_74634 [Rhizodiscina lignyota]|uniref:Rho-GAP domain-containing protein n=1 Tax=Rhizodiscina lignyota TaxID=1504668 RepID=A0A9P4IM96_9PEZI|nr:hypothetical protein NA57DRAFT_74634 [Rhizodiscina lignyota]